MDCERCPSNRIEKPECDMPDCSALYCRNRLKDRLADYEDIGLTPDEIITRLQMMAELEDSADRARLLQLAAADKKGWVITTFSRTARCGQCVHYNKPRLGWCEVHMDTEPVQGFCYWGEPDTENEI